VLLISPESLKFFLGSDDKSGNGSLGSPVEIEAKGKNFEWSFRYPGRDGKLGTSDDLRSGKKLHLPLGIEVILKLASEDFIYLMSCPELGLQQIAVPELTHTLEFHTGEIGSFGLQVDPLCGWRPLHDDLMGQVVVRPAADFEAWFKKSIASQRSIP
jgi:cytochrome c oxidase subunit 2